MIRDKEYFELVFYDSVISNNDYLPHPDAFLQKYTYKNLETSEIEKGNRHAIRIYTIKQLLEFLNHFKNVVICKDFIDDTDDFFIVINNNNIVI